MNAISQDRVLAMLIEAEAIAASMRAAFLGCRVDVVPDGWTDVALRGLEKRALDLEWLLRQFRCEIAGEEFRPPLLDRQIKSAGAIN